jgi:membrane-bound inhibitor of C-type lysozyme
MRRNRKRWLLALAGALAVMPPATAQVFTTYHCRDGSEFVAAFYEGDKRAHLQLDGKAITLPKRVALTGVRYARGDLTLRISKGSVTLRRGKGTTDCTPY